MQFLVLNPFAFCLCQHSQSGAGLTCELASEVKSQGLRRMNSWSDKSNKVKTLFLIEEKLIHS